MIQPRCSFGSKQNLTDRCQFIGEFRYNFNRPLLVENGRIKSQKEISLESSSKLSGFWVSSPEFLKMFYKNTKEKQGGIMLWITCINPWLIHIQQFSTTPRTILYDILKKKNVWRLKIYSITCIITIKNTFHFLWGFSSQICLSVVLIR